MGQEFSVEAEFDLSGKTGQVNNFSSHCLMLFKYENSNFDPISILDFASNPDFFKQVPIILIEPSENSGFSPVQSDSSDKIISAFPIDNGLFKQKISLKQFRTSLNNIFKTIQYQLPTYRLWILSSSAISQSLLSQTMSACRTAKFSQFVVKKSILANELFFDLNEQANEIVHDVSSALRPPKIPSCSDKIGLNRPININCKNSNFTNSNLRSLTPVSTSNVQKFELNIRRSFDESSISLKKGNDIDMVVPHLFISDEIAATNNNLLKDLGITHIVNINNGHSYVEQFNSIKYFNVLMKDSVFEELNDNFYSGIEFIKRAIDEGGNVLVHCRRGISRSATMCVAFMILEMKFSYKQALKILKKQRPIININQGFELQLKEKAKEKKIVDPVLIPKHNPKCINFILY